MDYSVLLIFFNRSFPHKKDGSWVSVGKKLSMVVRNESDGQGKVVTFEEVNEEEAKQALSSPSRSSRPQMQPVGAIASAAGPSVNPPLVKKSSTNLFGVATSINANGNQNRYSSLV